MLVMDLFSRVPGAGGRGGGAEENGDVGGGGGGGELSVRVIGPRVCSAAWQHLLRLHSNVLTEG